MAHNVEPMDVDHIDSDFDNKENSFHHSNLLPCTEKGYEELDVSELNMQLRYSVTPVSSPMSKSFTACTDNRNADDTLNDTKDNLTRSLNSTINKNDSIIKTLRPLPLQTIPAKQVDGNRNTSVLRQLDTTITDTNNITVTISPSTDIDENISLPSTSSSALQTPEATTPVNDLKSDGSPIMRGLKSVLNMFRSSQSPIPPADTDNNTITEQPSTPEIQKIDNAIPLANASTPIAVRHSKDGNTSRRSSPLKESIIFNDDLEKELHWKDETTIIFSDEKIPLHKLFFQTKPTTHTHTEAVVSEHKVVESVNTTVEYMDISYNDSILKEKNDEQVESKDTHGNAESDNEFVDCETTITNNNCQDILDNTHTIEATDPSFGVTMNLTNNIENIVKQEKVEKTIGKGETEDEINKTEIVTLNNDEFANKLHFSLQPNDADSTISIINELNELIENKEFVTKEEQVGLKNNACLNAESIEDRSTVINDTIQINDELTTENRTLSNGIVKQNTEEILVPTEINVSQELTEETLATEMSVNDKIEVEKANEQIQSAIGIVSEAILSTEDKEQAEQVNSEVTKLQDQINSEVTETYLKMGIPEDKQIENEQVENKPSFEAQEEELCIENIENKSEAVSVHNKNNNQQYYIEMKFTESTEIHPMQIADTNHVKIANTDINTADMTEINTTTDLNTPISIGNNKTLELTKTIENPADIPLPDEDEIEQDNLNSVTNSEVINNMIENDNPGLILDNTFTTPSDTTFTNLPIKEKEVLALDSLDDMTIILNEKEDNIGLDVQKMKDNITEISSLPDLVSQTVLMGKEISTTLVKETAVTDHSSENSEYTENAVNVQVEDVTKPVLDEILTASDKDLKDNTSDQSVKVSGVTSTSTFVIGEKMSNVTVILESNVTESITNLEKISVSSSDNIDTMNIVEEIVTSENNSPYVSLMTGLDSGNEDNFEEVENPTNLTNNAPSSPPIVSRGYNFNFDEMDDPFATKTKIRLSPPPNTPNKVLETENKDIINKPQKEINRRKSQPPERKRPVMNRNKLNSTDIISSLTKSSKIESDNVEVEKDDMKNTAPLTYDVGDKKYREENTTEDSKEIEAEKIGDETVLPERLDGQSVESSLENKSITGSYTSCATKNSSDQSVYHSAATSSIDSMAKSKNVFNLPEIDDINFNPFASKCKIKTSPDPSLTLHSIGQNDENDKMDTELMEKETAANISFVTSSSKSADDKNLTHEMHTEDEDTEEGPFLDSDDVASGDDMMKFDELPIPKSSNKGEDNETGELFIDAQAFEFLLNQNQHNVVMDSGKESLFLKFDPLFAKRLSTSGALAALNKIRGVQNVPLETKSNTREEPSVAGPSDTLDVDITVSQESSEDLNNTVNKPTMKVTPAINPTVTPRNKPVTPNRNNRRSIITSPAMAVIDRLLSLSANNSPANHDSTNLVRREQTEADLALTQLRDLLAEKENEVHNLRTESKELKERLTTMESQVKTLEADGQKRLIRINELNNKLAEKTKINKNMAAVVEEYERTISSLIAAIEQDKKKYMEERTKLINERDEQTAHLSSMEVSFSDLHSKYEKSKQIILVCKANEETCKKTLKEFEENFSKMHQSYETLKQHASSALNQANLKFESMTKAHESEILKLTTMIKRKDVHITSLEESLAQKIKANEELTAICDELINKVG